MRSQGPHPSRTACPQRRNDLEPYWTHNLKIENTEKEAWLLRWQAMGVCGPFSALEGCRYRVKLLPGSGKRSGLHPPRTCIPLQSAKCQNVTLLLVGGSGLVSHDAVLVCLFGENGCVALAGTLSAALNYFEKVNPPLPSPP